MATTTAPTPGIIDYERDFHAWCTEQAAHLRQRARPGANDGLDYENLAEEIEGLARSDKRAIKSQMLVLLIHLLKWQFQSDHRSKSWQRSISNARNEIADLLLDSPSLKRYARDVIDEVYPRAAEDAAAETGFDRSVFPMDCPFANAQVVDPDFLPP